ncbi:MAG: DNA polymerase III subunit beta, partial [Erysipelotrichaceae bacterium]|nr:DNA polymerase III subunit beta [Erysipelotrichaceae bacterium]
MYFKISKKEFLDKINIVSRAVSLTSPLPVLHNIKLATRDNVLQLTASDSDISIEATIFADEENGLQIIRDGSILLDGRYLADMIRKIDSESVEVEVVDGTYTSIRGISVNFETNGIRSDTYPLIDFSEPEDSFIINSGTLKNLVYQTCFAASDKETRPVLTGLNLNCEGNNMTCVATDSYRLAQKKIVLDTFHKFNVTIPTKSMNDIAKIIGDDENVRIALNDKKALFIAEEVMIQTRLIDGLYPETSRLIPAEFAHELVVDARDILNALDRASFIKNEGVCIIKMELNENEINVTSRTNELMSAERIVPISYVGEPLTISFKGNYVYDAIRALNALKVKISFSGNMKPFIIKSMDDDDILQLVLPIK